MQTNKVSKTELIQSKEEVHEVPPPPPAKPAAELDQPKGEGAKAAGKPAPKMDGKPAEAKSSIVKATNMEDSKPAEQPICNGRNKGECEHGTLAQDDAKNTTKSFCGPSNSTKSFCGPSNSTKSFSKDDAKNATKSFIAKKLQDVEAPLHPNGSSISLSHETPKNGSTPKSFSQEEPKKEAKEGDAERTRTHKYPNGLQQNSTTNSTSSKMAKQIPDAAVQQVKKALRDNDTLIISQDFAQTHNIGMFAQVQQNVASAFKSAQHWARHLFGFKN